jgi:hypothetical protein
MIDDRLPVKEESSDSCQSDLEEIHTSYYRSNHVDNHGAFYRLNNDLPTSEKRQDREITETNSSELLSTSLKPPPDCPIIFMVLAPFMLMYFCACCILAVAKGLVKLALTSRDILTARNMSYSLTPISYRVKAVLVGG